MGLFRNLKGVPLKSKVTKNGSAYVVRIPKVLVDCGYFKMGCAVEVCVIEDED